MFIALILIGVWYIILTYAWIVGIGFDGFTKAATTDPNLIATVGKQFWGGASVLLTLALINGIIANGGAAINTGSRVMYAMSRAGVLPKLFGKTHPKHQTPQLGVLAQIGVGIIIALIFGFVWDPITGLTILGLTIGVAVVLVYITCCIACIGFYRKKAAKDGTTFNVLLHGVLPTIGSIAFLIPLYKNYVPLPSWPNQWSNWLVVAWLIMGIGVVTYLSKKRPEALATVEETLGNVES
jgi:amino acid transporter